tara:strand:+ start:1811 stop:2743 length:933 start_codon:yes stop_codon:yes gene_type:complete
MISAHKVPFFYECEKCDYNTSHKSHFAKHVTTLKHRILTNTDNSDEKVPRPYMQCACGKTYIHRQSIFTHRKKCTIFKNAISDDCAIDKETILAVLNDSKDIKNLLVEQQKQIIAQQEYIANNMTNVSNASNCNNTYNYTANVKQKFNINVFLNEQCKNAVNLNDFIKSIQVDLQQLDYTKNNGLANGLTNIIMQNIKNLNLYERPMHCTDIRRETLYIKNNNNWSKDDNKESIKEAINKVSTKQFRALNEWMKENPDYITDENKQNYYAKTISVIGKSTNTIDDKIIKKICNDNYVKMNLKDLDENLIE